MSLSKLVASSTCIFLPFIGFARSWRTFPACLTTSRNFNTHLWSNNHLDVCKGNLNKQIFCNVELNGDTLQAVGFDMDFTLAQVVSCSWFHFHCSDTVMQYNQRFDLLAFEGAKQKLVNLHKYPEEIINFAYW